MLSNEEKNRIQLEEQYRNEVSQKFETKSKLDVVETITKILQGIAIIVGIWATYYAYTKEVNDRIFQERQSAEQVGREYRKGFYEKQFDLYLEASEVVATLATEKIGSAEYLQARKKFERLYWGKLSVVENRTIEDRMKKFGDLLVRYEQRSDHITQGDLQDASLDLAHAASKYTINVWLDSAERKNYNR